MIKLMQDGKEHYFDKNGIEIVKGSIIRYPDGREREVYETENGDLGTDAANPAWVESGKAASCEYGVYPLENGDCKVVEVITR